MDPDPNAVMEPTAANPTLGLPRLEPDGISDSESSHIGSLLDAAFAESGTEPPAETDQPAENLLGATPAPEIVPAAAPATQPDPIAAAAATVTVPVTDPAAAGTVPSVPDLDPEIEAIPAPRNLSPANQSNWNKVKELANKYKLEADSLRPLQQKVQELESRPAATPPDYEELKRFRNIFDTERDPEFISKYDAPIKNAEESIYGALRKHMTKETADRTISDIQKAGGPGAVDEKWWVEVINKLSGASLLDGETVKKGVIDIKQLSEGRTKEIESAAGKREGYLQEQESKKMETFQQEVAQIKQHVDKVTATVPWAQYRQAKPGATPEEIAEVAAHNKSVDQLDVQFQAAMYPADPVARANVALAATASHVLAAELGSAQKREAAAKAEIERLNSELSEIKSAGRAPRSTVTTTSKPQSTTSDRMKMSAMDAIDAGLAEAEGGY